MATVCSGVGAGLLADFVHETLSFVTESLTLVHPTGQGSTAGQSARDVSQVTGDVAA